MSSTASEPVYSPLITGLLSPKAYDHPVASVDVVETHISWILLAGEFAYKIKKPVDFGFLDFSTLDRRRFYCKEELRLNRRYAPDLYLAVVPVTGDPTHPRLSGWGSAIEYAVKMRRFDQAQRLDHIIQAHRLLPEAVDRLADTVASFHMTIDRASPEDRHGLPEHQQQAAELNFSTIEPLLHDSSDIAALDHLKDWTKAEYRRLEPLLSQRKLDGFVRECHGDLHLGNIVLTDGRPTLFDGIEFNEDLRWIDVQSELAFLVMDLEASSARAIAYRLLNHYLEITGDYSGLVLLDYYRLYRALVRAKIRQLERTQTEDAERKKDLLTRYRSYIDYGLELIRPKKPRLIITHGVTGSGKSHLAAALAERLPAIRLRSDVERKRLAGITKNARTGSTIDQGIYSVEMTEKTYRHLVDLAKILLSAGHSVIVDATFLKRGQRAEQQRIAEDAGADFLILDCQAPLVTLRERILTRGLAGEDPSDANLLVLKHQLGSQEPLAESESRHVLAVDTAKSTSMKAVLDRLGSV